MRWRSPVRESCMHGHVYDGARAPLDSRTELLKEHQELLRELGVAMEESRRTRQRLALLRQRISRLENEVEIILSRREPAPVPPPAPNAAPAPSVAPEPSAASEVPLPALSLIPEPQSV